MARHQVALALALALPTAFVVALTLLTAFVVAAAVESDCVVVSVWVLRGERRFHFFLHIFLRFFSLHYVLEDINLIEVAIFNNFVKVCRKR